MDIQVEYPGNDPTKPPAEDFRWKPEGSTVGTDRGTWKNDKTGEQWHPDLNHGGRVGPHWDYKDPTGYWWRVFGG